MPREDLDKIFEEVSGCRTGLLWLLLPFPPVFLLLAAVDSRPGLNTDKIIWYVLSAICIALFVFQRLQRGRAFTFLAWLWDNRVAVRSNGALFGETRVQSSTVFAQFEVVFSMLVMSTRQRTSYVVAGTAPAIIARLCAILATLLLGWWSLHGIVWTVVALIRNLGPGSRTTAEAILDAIEQRVDKAAAG